MLITRIRDQHTQDFDTKCLATPRLSIISKLKENPCRISMYLKCSPALRKSLARLRLSSHNLCIETGRWTKPTPTPRDHRFCYFCKDVVEDDLHFLFVCPKYDHLRRLYIPTNISNISTDNSLIDTLNSLNLISIRKIAIFVLKCFKIRDAAMTT